MGGYADVDFKCQDSTCCASGKAFACTNETQCCDTPCSAMFGTCCIDFDDTENQCSSEADCCMGSEFDTGGGAFGQFVNFTCQEGACCMKGTTAACTNSTQCCDAPCNEQGTCCILEGSEEVCTDASQCCNNEYGGLHPAYMNTTWECLNSTCCMEGR